MENEDLFEWKKGTYYLPRIGVEIIIHPAARVLNLEENLPAYAQSDRRIELDKILGTCIPSPLFGREDGIKYQFVIGHVPTLSPFSAAFVQGHEEGHLLSYLGYLETLRKEAQRLGYQFTFLTPEFCEDSDHRSKRMLSMRHTHADYKAIWRQEKVLAESIANVGGLVSIVKFGASEIVTTKLRKAIAKMVVDPLSEIEEIDQQ